LVALIVDGVSAFLIFFGRGGPSDIERQLDTVKIAIGAVVLSRARDAGFSRLYGVTNDEEAAAGFRASGAAILAPRTNPFHFGRELSGIIREKALDRVCTIGAGAGALLETRELRSLREDLESSEAVVLSNNSYSADLVAFTPAAALDAIDLPATDNPLPRRLHQQAGLSSRQLAKSAATLLDVDTPTDAALLARHPKCPPELRTLHAWQEILADRIEALMRLVTTPDKELLVAGRVGAPVWTFIETQTACRVRMLAEERGMQAAGRDTSGEARSALGFLYEKIGPREFFQRMHELCDGMLFDTRVLFAHMGWRPGGEERFASDLFMADRISAGPLRDFTEAARGADFPLLLGGHTLVSGVLWTMVEAAWAGHPEP
jgi:CTP:molybdopterin cytidylyltransferase MocA